MMKEYFENIIRGIEERIREDPENAGARMKYALEVSRLGSRLYGGEGRVAWCGVLAPFDLLSAFGITSCYVEFVGASLASSGMAGPMLEAAEHDGYSPDACGYHRAVIGAASQGLLPAPDLLIATSCPCVAGVATMENLAHQFKKDLFILHIPQVENDANIQYLADQIEEMVKFVAERTGQNPSAARIAEAITMSNTTRDLMVDIFRLARHIPTPIRTKDLRDFGIVMPLLSGTQAAVDLAEAFRDQLSDRVETGKGGIADERIRLLWIQNRIQFKNPLEKFLEEEHKAVIVIDELNSITWEPIDPMNPFPGIARRMISSPFAGNIEARCDHLKKLALEYKVDGVVNPCHWGCRQGTGARGLFADSFRQIDLPVLNLEVDCIDVRNFSEGQLKTRLGAFCEMLSQRPRPSEAR
jgi:benzoyl-CoA reductase/2-hydroxyglutaryl-CoA dehydratase subunit BcrC/BadD/HgdB